jgi:hypothetical protein
MEIGQRRNEEGKEDFKNLLIVNFIKIFQVGGEGS